jgi:hypothetical protein
VAACSADRPGSSGDANGNSVTQRFRGAFTLVPQSTAPYSEVNVEATLQLSAGTAQCGGYTARVTLTGGTGPTLGCGTLQGSTITFATFGTITVLRAYQPGYAIGDLGASDLQISITGIYPESFTASYNGTLEP